MVIILKEGYEDIDLAPVKGKTFVLVAMHLFIYHLLPRGSTTGTPPESPRGMVQFWYFFFSPRGEELFSFGNNLDIPTGFVRVLVNGITVFGKDVANPLRSLSNKDLQRRLKFAIQSVIFQATEPPRPT